MKCSEKTNLYETENRLVIVEGWGVERDGDIGEGWFMSNIILFRVMECLKSDSGDGLTDLWIY